MAETHYDERLGEWDGDEYNGWRFVTYAEMGLADDNPEPIDNTKIWVARTQPRDQETGSIAFDMSFNVGTDDEMKLRVPIIALMNMNDNSFPYEEVTEAVNDWVDTAKRFPHTRRNCLCCWNRATKGKVLCQGCHTNFGEVIYAD